MAIDGRSSYSGRSLGLLASLCLLLLSFVSVKVALVDSFSPPKPSGSSGKSGYRCHEREPFRFRDCHYSAAHSGRVIGIDRITIATSLRSSSSQQGLGQEQPSPRAVLLVGISQSNEEEQRLVHALKSAGYVDVEVSATTRLDVLERTSQTNEYFYELSRATGMLKRVSSLSPLSQHQIDGSTFDPPMWIPMVRGEEHVLVANGWSFLDPDESEPMSAFDIDDANAEGEYRPKWGKSDDSNDESSDSLQHSSLGYDLTPLSKERVLSEADSLKLVSKAAATENNQQHNQQCSREVLLHGKTDSPNIKTTCNGYDFRGSAGQSDIPKGIFFTAIGGLPLFSSTDLSPTTASSGWLSFARPIDAEHVIHTEPDSLDDQRIEVVCARSKCHLGHYFGPTDGYCINASALRFLPGTPIDDIPPTTATMSSGGDSAGNFVGSTTELTLPVASRPVSWRPLETGFAQTEELPPSHRLLKTVLETHGRYERLVLGCGCFWHVEAALRNLQGVVATEACYAGGHTGTGTTAKPTYREVCDGSNGHAEVVSVVYDPGVCPTNVLIDCFLAMHDPTMVKAHGKYALRTGQYRSCVFVESDEIEKVAKECLDNCHQQLRKELSTEIRNMSLFQQQQQQPTIDAKARAFGEGWCWRAEDEHQRYDERIKGGTLEALPTGLSATKWLKEYGRRTSSIIGGSLESSLHPDDDGMAMMMI